MMRQDVNSVDNRRAARKLVHKRITIFVLRAEGRVPVQAVLMDISASGLGICHSDAIDANEQFAVPMTAADGSRRWLLYRCVHCRRVKDGKLRTGAEFVRRLTETPPAAAAPEDQALTAAAAT